MSAPNEWTPADEKRWSSMRVKAAKWGPEYLRTLDKVDLMRRWFVLLPEAQKPVSETRRKP